MKDILLNYFMLVIDLAYCAALLWKHDRKHVAWCCLVGVIIFQWSLCLAVACSGISIIWCTMCGWAMDHRRRQQEQQQGQHSSSSSSEIHLPTNNQGILAAFFMTIQEYGTGVILLNVIVVVYYAIVMEAITTVAHICAFILGALLHICFVGGDVMNTQGAAAIPLLQGSSHDPVSIPDSDISGTM